MARPKKFTPAGIKATKKWKETMLAKYGGEEGLHNAMVTLGHKGGSRSFTGGFYVNRDLAKEEGKKIGKITKRGLKFIEQKWGKYYYEDKHTGEIIVCKYDKKTDKIVRIGGNNEE